ncbi:MAG: TRAP transporter large permease [Planctomycetota bacterium]|jgi:C4-dicarboxylate transporter DctM subunit|nr:TRAP transporter large permease [Planctomycetota bacterium]
MTLVLLFGSFFVLLLLNVPVAAAMGLATFIGIRMEDFSITSFANLMYASMSKSVLLAIPFFILAGVLMDYAGISRRLIRFSQVCVGHLRGGMAIVVVLVSCFFAAISGSGPATVAALGGILIPAMAQAGYNKNMSASLVAASGGIGIIIPPSIAFVIFAMLAEVSVGNLFMCGIVPGLVMGLAYCLAAFWSMRRDGTGVIRQERASVRECWLAFKDAVWGLLTPIIILGGIYGGIFTPTEASGVAVVYGLVVGLFIHREIKFRDLWRMFVDSAVTSAVVMFILGCAGVFGWLLVTTGGAEELSASFMRLSTNPYVILLLINIVFVIAGCFMEANSAYCIFLPILLPILGEIGYNPYAFGVFMVSSFAVGMITPPVGVNLFVACNVAKISMKDICSKVAPFVVAGFIAVFLFTYVPEITLFLPRWMGLKV